MNVNMQVHNTGIVPPWLQTDGSAEAGGEGAQERVSRFVGGIDQGVYDLVASRRTQLVSVGVAYVRGPRFGMALPDVDGYCSTLEALSLEGDHSQLKRHGV